MQRFHNSDVRMSTMASQITSVSIVYATVCSGPDQRKHQSSASLAFVRGIHRWPVNSPYKGPVTRKMFPFDDVSCFWRNVSVQLGPMALWLVAVKKLHVSHAHLHHDLTAVSAAQIQQHALTSHVQWLSVWCNIYHDKRQNKWYGIPPRFVSEHYAML